MLKEVEDIECEINKQLDTAIKKMVMFRIKILAFRQWESHSNSNVGVRFFYFCITGVAGFVVPTQKIEYTQTHYLTQKRNEFGDFCK